MSCNSPSGAHPPTTHQVIRKLALQEGAAALKALANAAGLEDQFERRAAIDAIGRHPHGRELRSIILRALRDPSEYVVRTACEVVAQWELQEAHELVVALLANPSKATRQTAIRTLGKIWVDADFRRCFASTTTPRKMKFGAKLLGSCGSEPTLPIGERFSMHSKLMSLPDTGNGLAS
ncbi:HEAT repeat domain-containing protein [Bradyrhizobium sp. SZCCHNRI3052]|uniref:HEAT repeat domain-containing protein n=1 Tax=Bradyrhizobium sp. SZCCHNRI3052 TaxID=3057295 RepID=UPI00396727AC